MNEDGPVDPAGPFFFLVGPSPVLVGRQITVAGPPRVVGREQEHLKLWLSDAGGTHIDALGWGMAGFIVPIALGCTPAWSLIICLIASAVPAL